MDCTQCAGRVLLTVANPRRNCLLVVVVVISFGSDFEFGEDVPFVPSLAMPLAFKGLFNTARIYSFS